MMLLLPTLAHACSCYKPLSTPCRSLLEEDAAIFVGTVVDVENPASEDPMADQRGMSRYTFAVTETFAGTQGGEVIAYSGRGGADCSYHFKKGERYLVYASRMEDKTLYVSMCSRTQPLADAEVHLRQLRAAKEGRPVASLYGVLQRTLPPGQATLIKGYDQPIKDTTVRLQAKDGKVFTANTSDAGEFAFYDLPAGVYQVSAGLPRNLIIARPQFNQVAGFCTQYYLEAMPRAQIKGHLIGPDGKSFQGAVELFADGRYSDKMGWWEYSKGKEGFLFEHVTPGNYVLVFNNWNGLKPEAPFERTFYPGVDDLLHAGRIHVSEDDQIITADIHLSGGEENTQVTVRLVWPENNQEKPDLAVYVYPDRGDDPHPDALQDNLFSLTLLKRAVYKIKGVAYCKDGKPAETTTVKISGSDVFTGPMVLRFPENACAN